MSNSTGSILLFQCFSWSDRRHFSLSENLHRVRARERENVKHAHIHDLPHIRIFHFHVQYSLRMYNNLVEKCFSECVNSFRRKSLEKDEERCVSKCCEKFLKHSARVSVRFAELNAQTMEQQPPPSQ